MRRMPVTRAILVSLLLCHLSSSPSKCDESYRLLEGIDYNLIATEIAQGVDEALSDPLVKSKVSWSGRHIGSFFTKTIIGMLVQDTPIEWRFGRDVLRPLMDRGFLPAEPGSFVAATEMPVVVFVEMTYSSVQRPDAERVEGGLLPQGSLHYGFSWSCGPYYSFARHFSETETPTQAILFVRRQILDKATKKSFTLVFRETYSFEILEETGLYSWLRKTSKQQLCVSVPDAKNEAN